MGILSRCVEAEQRPATRIRPQHLPRLALYTFAILFWDEFRNNAILYLADFDTYAILRAVKNYGVLTTFPIQYTVNCAIITAIKIGGRYGTP